MSDHDLVEAIREPYDPRLRLWKREGRRLEQGDKVPVVGMASTYAVRLHSPASSPARYLWVQDGVITNPMAHQPIGDASVFDAWGRYLGRGGSPLDPPGTGTLEPLVVLREVPPTVEQPSATEAPTTLLTHRFHLRRDLEIQVSLPADINERDVERLCAFLRTLPFPSPRST